MENLDGRPLFPGMTDEEIQNLITATQPSEERLQELREKIAAQETPEGKAANEALRKKYGYVSKL